VLEPLLLPPDAITSVVTVKVTRRSRSTTPLPYLSPLSFITSTTYCRA
jgi:hypothetical protein